jgi:hypothetical protein
MDKPTRGSLWNCVKELESLSILSKTGVCTEEEISDFIQEIGWNIVGVIHGKSYISDEFQMRLSKFLKEKKNK